MQHGCSFSTVSLYKVIDKVVGRSGIRSWLDSYVLVDGLGCSGAIALDRQRQVYATFSNDDVIDLGTL